MQNPDPYIRAAYLNLFGSLTIGSVQVPVYVDEVPISVTPIPRTRILITTQTKSGVNDTKCGHEWMCSILLDIISEQQRGYVNRTIVDNIEQQISDLIDLWTLNGVELMIPPFTCYYTKAADSHSILLDTPTTTIIRKLVRYTHRLNGI